MNESARQDLLKFLHPSTREDVRLVAAQQVCGLTGTDDGRSFIAADEELLQAIIALCYDDRLAIVKFIIGSLVNMTGDNSVVTRIMNLGDSGSKSGYDFVSKLLVNVLSPKCVLADTVAMLLSNLSRFEGAAEVISRVLDDSNDGVSFQKLVDAVCTEKYNEEGATLDFLIPFLGNLSQVPLTRRVIFCNRGLLVRRLLPFTQHPIDVRRRGAATLLKNCSFDQDYHEILLSEEFDALSYLLLPLAGPEEFDEEDNDKLPPDLQYLGPDKTREPSPDLRKMLVEALMQLCSTKPGRLQLRDCNVYVIMREYYEWEKNTEAKRVALQLIEILIGDEPAPEHSNLHQVDVPKDIAERFKDADMKEAEADRKEAESDRKEAESDRKEAEPDKKEAESNKENGNLGSN